MREKLIKGKKIAISAWQCVRRGLPLWRTAKEGMKLAEEMYQPFSFSIITGYVKQKDENTFLYNREFFERVQHINGLGARQAYYHERGREIREKWETNRKSGEGWYIRFHTINNKGKVHFYVNPVLIEKSKNRRTCLYLVLNSQGEIFQGARKDEYGFFRKIQGNSITNRYFSGGPSLIRKMEELVKESAEKFSEITIGTWDVILTEDGPKMAGMNLVSETIYDLQMIHYLFQGVGLRRELLKEFDRLSGRFQYQYGNGEALARHAEAWLKLDTRYVWGGLGTIITQELIDEKRAMYPGTYHREYVEHLQACVGKEFYGVDCSGLIKNYLMGGLENFQYDAALDLNAEMLYAYAETSGDMDSVPEVRGLCLYMEGHVGIYVGNGKVIESTSNKKFGDGVCQTTLKDRVWLKWFQCPGVAYKEN